MREGGQVQEDASSVGERIYKNIPNRLEWNGIKPRRHLDRGSSVIVKFSFVRKLRNISEFEYIWPLILDLDLEIWRQIFLNLKQH